MPLRKLGPIIIVFIISLMLLTYFALRNDINDFFPPAPERGVFTIEIKGFPLGVEVAQTVIARQRGLSDRSMLSENRGMLFVFKEAGLHGIWMKDMRFPIDILWLDAGGVVLDFMRNALPESYPHVFYPRRSATFVLEIPANFTELHGVKIGDVVSLPKDFQLGLSPE